MRARTGAPRRGKVEDGVGLSIVLESDTLDKIREIAERGGVSLSAVIRDLIAEGYNAKVRAALAAKEATP